MQCKTQQSTVVQKMVLVALYNLFFQASGDGGLGWQRLIGVCFLSITQKCNANFNSPWPHTGDKDRFADTPKPVGHIHKGFPKQSRPPQRLLCCLLFLTSGSVLKVPLKQTLKSKVHVTGLVDFIRDVAICPQMSPLDDALPILTTVIWMVNGHETKEQVTWLSTRCNDRQYLSVNKVVDIYIQQKWRNYGCFLRHKFIMCWY